MSTAPSQCPVYSMGKQRGAALIMALLIVVLVAALGVKFGEAFTLSIARAENRWYGLQAQSYLLATETVAASFLEDDAADNEYDHLGETWAAEIVVPTDDGMLAVELEDAQGRFNLNGLSLAWQIPQGNPNPQPYERFSPQQRRFIRLLQTFEKVPVTEQEAIEITEAVIDWLDNDGDQLAGFGGAESLYYENLSPPYEPANQLFFSVSELQMVKGITPELYVLLEPLMIALPEADATLNLNTALPPLLQTLNDQTLLTPLPIGEITPILEERGLQPFQKVEDFFDNPAIKNVAPNMLANNAGFGVASNFFLMHAKTSVGEQVRYVKSDLSRIDGKVKVIKRRYTSY